MSSLLFTRGLNPPQTLPDPVAPGDTTFALTGADAVFAPGDLLFIGENDGAQAEYLGSVSAADSASVSFTLPALSARPAGASLFSPVDVIRTTARLEPPLKRHLDTGVQTQRTLGGRVVAIRTAESAARIELALAGLTPDEERKLIDGLSQATDFGRLPFTLVSSSRRLLALHIADPEIRRTTSAGGRHAVRFNAFELGEGVVL